MILARRQQDMGRYSALATVLVGRELKARYRGTALGFLWSFANPLLNVAIYVTVFASAFRMPHKHYAAFVLCGLLPWNTFVVSINEGMNAIIHNGNLIKKVYLPAEVFPMVATLHNMVHLLLSLPVLVAVILFSDVHPSFSMAFLPVLLFLQLMFTFSITLILSSLATQFRDLLHIVPNLLTMWFYLTPIIYDRALLPPRVLPYLRLNPLAGLIDSYRAILLEGKLPNPAFLASFAGITALLLVIGLYIFERRRDFYAELV